MAKHIPLGAMFCGPDKEVYRIKANTTIAAGTLVLITGKWSVRPFPRHPSRAPRGGRLGFVLERIAAGRRGWATVYGPTSYGRVEYPFFHNGVVYGVHDSTIGIVSGGRSSGANAPP